MWKPDQNNGRCESSFVNVFIFQVFLSSWQIENEKEPPLVLLMCFGFNIWMCVHIICTTKASPKLAEFETVNKNENNIVSNNLDLELVQKVHRNECQKQNKKKWWKHHHYEMRAFDK